MSWLDERSQWKALGSIGMVEVERHIGDTVTVEHRYYLSSLQHDVEQFANAARGHWGIENSVHWVLDVSFREDDSRVRTGLAFYRFFFSLPSPLKRRLKGEGRGIQFCIINKHF